MCEIRKEGRKRGRWEEKLIQASMAKGYSFAQGEPKIRNYVNHTRKETMNNSMLLIVCKIKPTHPWEEAQLTDTKN